jgi:hypothetical protein
MADDRDTIDQAHRFLGKISQAPVKQTGGADAPDDDLDENARKDDAEKRAGSRDVDQGAAARPAEISVTGLSKV